MKKLIALLLCIVSIMSMAIPAFATEAEDNRSTIVSMTLDPSMETYTLTIPATITIDPAVKSATLKITLENVNLVWHKRLAVYAMPTNRDTVNGGSYLINTEDATKKIHYNLKSQDGQILQATDTTMSTAYYYLASDSTPYLQNGRLELTVDGDYPGAGTYTDTITFTVKLS